VTLNVNDDRGFKKNSESTMNCVIVHNVQVYKMAPIDFQSNQNGIEILLHFFQSFQNQTIIFLTIQ